MPPRHIDAPVIQAEEIVVSQKRVACDGGGGALGHPLVYMEMGEDNSVECKYCDRLFVLAADVVDGHGYVDPAARPPEVH